MSSSIENREGFFDMSMDNNSDSALPNSVHNNTGNSGSEINKSSSESDSETEKGVADDTSVQLRGLESTDPVDIYDKSLITEPPTKTRTEKILDKIHKRAPPRVIRRILKCSIAYFISTLFSTIYPVAKVLGQAPYIACTGVLLCHPGRTMGAQFDSTLTAALGAAFAIVYGLAGVSAATAYNSSHPDSHAGAGINCMFLVLGVFGAQLLRQKFPKLNVFSVQFMIVQLFTLTIGVGYKKVPLRLSSDFGLCLLIGNFVSLIINLLFWPETAVDSFGRTLSDSLFDSQEMLNTITKQFFLDPKSNTVPAKILDDMADKLRRDKLKVNTAYQEAKYEISYAYSCSEDLNPIRTSLNRVTKHLGILSKSLKSEQALFENTEFFSSKHHADNLNTHSDNHTRRSSESSVTRETHDINAGHLHPQTTNKKHNTHTTKDYHAHQSALEAAISYMKDGTYTKPHDEDSVLNKNDIYKEKNSSSTAVDDLVKDKNATHNTDGDLSNISVIEEHSGAVPSSSNTQKLRSIKIATPEFKRNNELDNISHSKRMSKSLSIHSLSTTASSTNISDKSPDPQFEKEENYGEDSNQLSYSSFTNFLQKAGLSNPKQDPPQRIEKRISYNEGHLLRSYLEKLRDPLISLATECVTVLDCVRDSLHDQLELPNDDDTGISHKSIWRYLLHTFKIKTISNEEHLNYLNKKKRSATFVCNCAETMRLRILQFDKCEKERMKALYKINQHRMKGKRLNLEIREELFLVFSFIFSLREVATELEQMSQEMRNLQLKTILKIQENYNPKREKKKKLFMPQITIQSWRKWFNSNNYQNVQDRGGYTFSYLQNHMPKENNQRDLENEYRLTQLATTHTTTSNNNNDADNNNISQRDDNSYQKTNNSSSLRRRDRVANLNDDSDEFVDMKSTCYMSDDQNPIGKPPPLLRFRYKLWLCVRYIQGYEFKFALKLSFAVGALTVPIYIPGYYEWFNAIRGQWAALTVIMVMSPTSGGTLSTGLWRLVGTLVGAFIAWAVLEIDDTSGYLLSGFAFLIALPSFYIHFSTSYSKAAIIILLNYMVIALGQYVNSSYYESVSEKVWQRTATLIIGLAVALFLNWVVWPFIARDAVRNTLASTIGELGDYFSYVMGTFLYHDEKLPPTLNDFKEAEKTEKELEKMLNTCNELLKLTDHEPRLKGPFPKEYYKEILVSAQNLLDRMISLRISLMKMSLEVKNEVRDMDKYLYRRDMVASILLHFYTVSSSLKAKIPLPPYMPSARSARLRLLKHRNLEDRPEKLLRYRNLTWFAMARNTEEIIGELEHLTDLIRFIVGESKFALKARRLEGRRLQNMLAKTDEEGKKT